MDDHPITRQGLAAMIGLEPDLHVCAEAENAADALTAVDHHRPDLVLLDLSLPGRSGLEFLKDLVTAHPGIPALVLSMHDESLYAERVLRAGAVTVRRTRVGPAAVEFKTDGYLASVWRRALQTGGASAPAALARASRQPRGVSSQMSFWGCRPRRGTMSHRYS